MNLSFILIIALSLSMDAFAVSVGLGIKHPNYRTTYAVKVALLFGFFQAIMPAVGWLLGSQFIDFVSDYDHWVAFIILAVIGIKMIHSAIKGTDVCDSNKMCESSRVLLFLALATSIDALATGFSFAFLSLNIFLPSLIIGAVTFCISFIGAVIGDKVGLRFKKCAEILGGSVLFLLGLKILLEHLWS